MKKILTIVLIATTFATIVSCKSTKTHCDAYSYNDIKK